MPAQKQANFWEAPAEKPGNEADAIIARLTAIPELQEAERRLRDYNRHSLGDVCDYTKNLYTDKDGKYFPERQAKHRQIVDEMLKPDTIAAPNARPQAILMIGNPGSGKTSTKNMIAQRIGVNFASLDSDEIKSKMPEYLGWNAPALHRESHDILKYDLLPRAVDERHNIVLDGTGRHTPLVWNQINWLASKGYDVHIGYVDLSPEKCAQRVVDRYLQNPMNLKEPGVPVGMAAHYAALEPFSVGRVLLGCENQSVATIDERLHRVGVRCG